MTRRMVIAALSFAGIFLAGYLALYKMGYIGTLACGVEGGCERVQTSRWADFLGQPVAVWGVGFYLAMFAVATAGSFGRFAHVAAPGIALFAMSAIGVLFSAWLTYLELGVIHAICKYCVGSAVLVCVLCWLSWREVRRA